MPQDYATFQQQKEKQREQDDLFTLDDTDSDIDSPTIVTLPGASEPRSFGVTSGSQMLKWFIRLTLLAGVIAGGFMAWNNPQVRGYFASDKAANTEYLLDKATRGPFRITVVERGQLDSMKNVTLVNQVQGSTTIISIVPEGTPVKEGDIVCVLDSSKWIDKQTSQKINISAAKANLETALRNVEIQIVKNESDLAAAQLKLDLADLDLRKYKEGEYLQLENEGKGAVTVAQLALTKAEESYEFTKRLSKKGYKTQIEVEADRISVTEAKIKLRSAEEKLRLLKDFTKERTVKELEEKARDAKSDIKRITLSGQASLAQFKATLESRELNYQVEQDDMKRVKEQIALCTMRAPQKGEVVYFEQSSRRGSESTIEEGTVIRERQSIIKLPDFTQMKVNARIHESRISLVSEGMKVSIRIDAIPDQVFKGVVHSVSPVPVAGSWYRPDLKEYEIEVEILGVDKGKEQLKPGLTAEVEVLVEARDDVLTVPMQAILGIGSKQYVYVLGADGYERRIVKTGQTNSQLIEIIDGVLEGEDVILNPRSSFGKELTKLEAEQKEAENIEANNSSKSDRTNKKNRPQQKTRSKQGNKSKRPSSQNRNGRPEKTASKNKRDPAAMFKKMDKNGDGKITSEELPSSLRDKFTSIDSNADGGIDAGELKSALQKMGKPQR